MKKIKLRPCDIISILGLLMIIYGFAVTMIVTPDKDFSKAENRSLQTLPKFSLENLTSGRYTSEMSAYCADQMPFRDTFVGTKGIIETVMLKNENNSVLLGKNQTLIAKDDYTDFAAADKNTEAINRFASSLDVPVWTAIAGRSQDILINATPSLYPARNISDKAFAYVNSSITDANRIDILSPLRARSEEGEYVYYRTDHHWTTLGAYYAYVEIMNGFGLEAYSIDRFTRETVTEEFYGTTWSKAGMKWIAPEPIEFFRYDGDETLELKIGNNVTSGVYDRSYLEKKSKYSTFIGETFASASIYPAESSPLNSDRREKLLIVKDSFSHSVVPFLALHFDIELIDLRYYKASTVTGFVEQNGISRVLILCSLDTVLNDPTLSAIAIGAK